MFFLRSSSTLRKSEIQRLEPIPTAPSNTPNSQQNEDSEYSQTSSENIPREPEKIQNQEDKKREEGIKIIFSDIDGQFVSRVKDIITSQDGLKKIFRDSGDVLPSNGIRSPYITYLTTMPSKIENDLNEKQITSKNPTSKKQNQENTRKKRTFNRYKNISSRVDTGRKKCLRERRGKKCEEHKEQIPPRHCLAIQTSNTCQDGSGDKDPKTETNQDKLERFRRINMEIMKAVSKNEESFTKIEPTTASEDNESDIESLEDLRREDTEEESAETLNEDAMKACLFLNENYPNYFQHLIIRYQLNVPTTDQKELKMRKMDIVRIGGDCEGKLERLEDMYKQRAVKNPVIIFCDQS